MHIISQLIAGLLAWLNAVEGPTQSQETAVDWADLPTYHPSRD